MDSHVVIEVMELSEVLSATLKITLQYFETALSARVLIFVYSEAF